MRQRQRRPTRLPPFPLQVSIGNAGQLSPEEVADSFLADDAAEAGAAEAGASETAEADAAEADAGAAEKGAGAPKLGKRGFGGGAGPASYGRKGLRTRVGRSRACASAVGTAGVPAGADTALTGA